MNLVVIFGGESCEHDISIMTGVQLIENCNEYIYNVIPVYIDKTGKWLTGHSLKDFDNYSLGLKGVKECGFVGGDNLLYIKKGKKLKPFIKIDCAILCLHGLRGEDGAVASIMEMSKIPYANSPLCSSSVCLDKCVFKSLAKGLGCCVVDGVSVSSDYFESHIDCLESLVDGIGFPCIIKPSRLGSSIGVSVCDKKDDLYVLLKNAFLYDKNVLIEKYIDIDKEINIALFSDKGEIVFSRTEEPITNDKILSFENKYLKNPGGFETIKRIVPAEITQEQEENIKCVAKLVYESLGMAGVVRLDFILDKSGCVYLNEVNTIPGSMANYLFDKEEYSYSTLIDSLVRDSIWRSSKDKKYLKVFNSEVLSCGKAGLKK